MPVQRILVGVDGSPGSRRALEWAAGRAADLDAEVVVVHVIRPMGEFVLDLPAFDMGDWRENLRWELDEVWCAPLREAKVRHRSLTVEGNPVQEILKLADREHADMIVVGAEGHGRLPERLLGGVSQKLAHRARQPVVILPPHPADESSS